VFYMSTLSIAPLPASAPALPAPPTGILIPESVIYDFCTSQPAPGHCLS